MRRLLLIACLVPGLPTHAALAQPGAQVHVYAEHRAGDVVYRYQLANPGTREVRRFRVGCGCRRTP